MISKSCKKVGFRVGGDRHLLKRGNEEELKFYVEVNVPLKYERALKFIKAYYNASDWFARQIIEKMLDKYTAKKDTIFCGMLFKRGESFYLPSDIAMKMNQLIEQKTP